MRLIDLSFVNIKYFLCFNINILNSSEKKKK